MSSFDPSQNNSYSGLCQGGCGFYGNSANEGYCSVCFKRLCASRKSSQQQNHCSSPLLSPTTSMSLISQPIVDVPVSNSSSSESTPVETEAPTEVVSSESKSESLETSPEVQNDDIQLTTDMTIVIQKMHSATTDIDVESAPSPLSSSSNEAVGKRLRSFTEPDKAPLDPVDAPDQPADSSRCFLCNKKLGLLNFKCRCGEYFCRPHQHAESHDCAFDYKGLHQKNLAVKNPKVIAAQLNKLE